MSQSSYEALTDVAQDVYGMVEAYVNSVESESDQIAMKAVMLGLQRRRAEASAQSKRKRKSVPTQ